MYIGADKVRVSVVPFYKTPNYDEVVKLKDTAGQAGLLNKIRALTCCDHGTFIPTAMLYAADEMLTPENGDRPDAPNVILVITDGVSTEGVKALRDAGASRVQQEEEALKKVKEAAARLRSKGTVFAIGIGVGNSDYGKQTIAAIAGPEFPNNQEIFPNVAALNAAATKMEQSIIDTACDRCVTPPEE
jgi:Mg-chelatase subunit ChlD